MKQDISQLEKKSMDNNGKKEEKINKADRSLIFSIVNLFFIVPSVLCIMLIISLVGAFAQNELLYTIFLFLSIAYGVISIIFFIISLFFSFKNSKKVSNTPVTNKIVIIGAFLIVFTVVIIELIRLFRVF